MEDVLYNPVYHALLSHDAHLGFGTESVRCFDEQVSPFTGFATENEKGFSELFDLLPAGRSILYATPQAINEPAGWRLLVAVMGLQFLYTGDVMSIDPQVHPVPLGTNNVEEMMQLAALTRPGPFGPRTIEFGHYYGIFEKGKLVAMAGQRLHVAHFAEISAVCTHPDHLGKGYAAALLQHQVKLIQSRGNTPFLHVREDNTRAIALYERLGFTVNRAMNFYFMKRRE